MKIRQLKRGEGAVFGQIRLESLRQEPLSFAAHVDDVKDYSECDWERLLAGRTAFVAFDGDRPVGLASLVEEPMSRMSHRASVTNAFVSSSHRRFGIATALFDAVEREARSRGIVQIELAVNADNSGAAMFYERRGYVQIGLVPRGFRHGKTYFDEILYCLALDAGGDAG